MLISLLTQHPEALPGILSRTPKWVWGLLAGLVVLGASQLVSRRASLTRVTMLPIAMTALSVYSLASALKASGQVLATLLVWLIAALLTAAAAMVWRATPPTGTQYDTSQRQFELPGSAMPLLLILAIFFTKYSVGIELALQPALIQSAPFSFGLAAVYGLINGFFAARALRLWRLARQTNQALAHTPALPA